MSFRPGTVFGGYRIERLLGRGGMGSVYLARHPRLPRLVALKVLFDDTDIDADQMDTRKSAERLELRRRFAQEATLVAALEHPNIVHIHDYSGPDSDTLWISMRYSAGGDMATLLVREGGTLPADRAVGLITQAAHGLDHAHRNRIMHRDVKPLNLLMDRAGDEERVIVTDFGIARMLDATRSAKAAPMTYAYAAPERFDSNVDTDHRSDVYSLGCTLYELLTGKKPYPATDLAAVMGAHLAATPPRPSEQVSGVPAGLDAVVARALAKRPGDRFGSCLELATAAEEALAGWSAPRGNPARPQRRSGPGAEAPGQAANPFQGYNLRQLLSHNTSWSVYSAWHPDKPGLFAVKILSATAWPTEDAGRIFVRELDPIASLDHPNIVKVHNYGLVAGKPWIAMRYIPGGTSLQALLDAAGGTLGAARAMRLVTELADGLDYAHRRGIVHRRIDPSNILLESVSAAERPVLINFGGRPEFENTQDEPSISWAAPEVLGGHAVDGRTDVYHLGCTLYRMLVGRPPFPDHDFASLVASHLFWSPPRPSEQRPGIPTAFDDVIAKALAKDPDQRYSGCREFAAAAEQSLVPHRQVPWAIPLRDQARPRPTWCHAARSDRGLYEPKNQDSVYAGLRLLVVADGMGSAASEVASQLVVAALAGLDDDEPTDYMIRQLDSAVRQGNAAIADEVRMRPEHAGISSTVTALLPSGYILGVAHIGSSRAYLLRDGELQQITRDNTRALEGSSADISVGQREVHAGDRYLLCTAGLTDVVSPETIMSTLQDGTVDERADRLIELALHSGGPSNVTVVVADVLAPDLPETPEKGSKLRWW